MMLQIWSQFRVLCFGANLLTGPLPFWLGGWRRYTSIRLSKNQFEGHLPPELGNCSSLITLGIDVSMLYGLITLELCHAKSLSPLSLSLDLFTGSLEDTFPECINLKNLLLDGNNFSRGIPTYLSSPSLVTLNMAQNYLSEKLPYELWSSQTFLGISLNNNFLVGRLSCGGRYLGHSKEERDMVG